MIYENLIANKTSYSNSSAYVKHTNKKYNGLSENLVKEIKKRAREGAQKNEYMYGDEFNNFFKSVRSTYASPDLSNIKSTALSKMKFYLNNRYTGNIFTYIWGYGANFITNNGKNPIIDIYEGDERILTYDVNLGGWHKSGMTKDERAFDNDFKELYLSEYRKAKAEIKNQQTAISTTKEASVNISKTESFSMSV